MPARGGVCLGLPRLLLVTAATLWQLAPNHASHEDSWSIDPWIVQKHFTVQSNEVVPDKATFASVFQISTTDIETLRSQPKVIKLGHSEGS